MNRRERRQTSKRLGIMEYQRNLPRDKKFNLMRENILSGKKIHEEFLRKSKMTQEEIEEEIKYQKIYSLATNIAQVENIPYVDAVEKAKIQIEQETKT